MQQIVTALSQGTQPAKRQDRQPVRGGSHRRGRCEATFWQRTNRQEVRQTVLAARIFEREQRKPGCAKGPLGHIGIDLLELLGNLVDPRTGRLEPSIAYLARTLGRCRQSVVDALKALRKHGFLDWLRRYEETGCEGAGPRVRQVSNAYRISLPSWAARRLRNGGKPPPLPDDVAQELEERAAETAAYKAALPLEALAVLQVEDSLLGRLLANMGRHVQGRESARQTEAISNGFI